MIDDSQSVNEILNKINLKQSNQNTKQPLNSHKKKKFKQNFQFLAKIAILFQQVILGFTFVYLLSQKVIYRIPIECQLIFNHPVCKITSSTIFTIIFLRIVRNLIKLYKRRKNSIKDKNLFYSYIFNCDITLQTYRYYLGIKIYIGLIFFIQILLENCIAFIHTEFYIIQLKENQLIYFGMVILIQLIILDLIEETFRIYGGKYQIPSIQRNYITIQIKMIYEAFCKLKIFKFTWQFIQLTIVNYKTYTRNKGIPLF